MITKLVSNTVPEKGGHEAQGEQPVSDAEVAEPSAANPETPAADLTATGSTKMSQAIDIYRRMTRKKGTTRRDIIEVFIEKVGLTKAGAATYYQMIKKSRRQD